MSDFYLFPEILEDRECPHCHTRFQVAVNRQGSTRRYCNRRCQERAKARQHAGLPEDFPKVEHAKGRHGKPCLEEIAAIVNGWEDR